MIRVDKDFALNMFSIDRTALVTGATGSGGAVAKAYCYQGANVVMTARNEKKLKGSRPSSSGGPLCAIIAGTRVEEDMKKAVGCAVEKFGG